METIVQPVSLANLLRSQLEKDSYNKFCIDCNKNESTHASVTYGVFICEECAQTHIKEFGMENSYVKSLFGELWDDYQCRCIMSGGNKLFWDFLKQYNLEWKPIAAKYKTKEAKYYKRRLAALA
jgi:threonyl-tRNA synthetase